MREYKKSKTRNSKPVLTTLTCIGDGFVRGLQQKTHLHVCVIGFFLCHLEEFIVALADIADFTATVRKGKVAWDWKK